MNASTKQDFQRLHFHWLAQKIVSASANRLDSISFFALSRNDDDLSRSIECKKIGQCSYPFVALVTPSRQIQVEKRYCRRCYFKGLQSAGAISCKAHFILVA